jgi:regulator of sigma E protease
MTILTTLLGIVIGVLSLVVLVVIHELGHAIIATRNGVVVEEFGIGFPPRAWSRRLKNGVLFSLNWLPLGGFVRMQGESDDSRHKGDYGRATLWSKTKILLAGVLVNYIAAFVIFTSLYLVGIPRVLPDQFVIASDTTSSSAAVVVTSVAKDSPAAQAGLKMNDDVLKLNGASVHSSQQLIDFTKSHPSQKVTIEYKRAANVMTTTATLRPVSQVANGLLGVGVGNLETLRATWSAPIDGLMFSGQVIGATFAGFGTLFGDLGHAQFAAAGNQVAGPVGIFGTIFPNALSRGGTWLLLTVGLISLSLAIMNTLPIPALDGGRWFVTALFRVIRRPLPRRLEERIHGTGFVVLLMLIAVITILDVGKLFA